MASDTSQDTKAEQLSDTFPKGDQMDAAEDPQQPILGEIHKRTTTVNMV